MGRRYQSIVETIGNTPVVRINRLAPQGVNLFVKIEAFNPLGSVKDRLALGVIEAAEKSGELKPGQTVIEATSGNTGIGLAMVCAAEGYPLVITMAEPFSVERRKLRASRNEDCRLRARGCIAVGQWHRAVAELRRHSSSTASDIQAASDAGLDAGFYPQTHRRCRRNEGHRSHLTDLRPRRHSLQQGPCYPGGHLCRH